MDEQLSQLLDRIYRYGIDNDSKTPVDAERMHNLSPESGLFLSVIIQATKARNVLEIGTSNGYSTLWIADALRQIGGGRVTTVEASKKKVELARNNFEQSGLFRFIDSHLEDARNYLKEVTDESVDLLFLDAERSEYTYLWKDLDRVIKTGGLLIVDNALIPNPDELVDFFRLVNQSGRYLTTILKVGKGELVALKQKKV